MKRLLSYLVLLMLFGAGSSFASVPLTSVTYSGNCETHLNEAISNGGTIYGNGDVPASAYADLSDYSTLTLTGTNVANARLLFNRLIDGGAYVEVVPGNSQYATVSNNVATIDLQAIRNANNQMVRLMVIKAYWGQTVTINSWELEPLNDERIAVKWNIDNGITIDGENVKNSFNNDNPILIPVRNSDMTTWTISPRFKVRNESTDDEIPVADLCNGSFDASYFEVIYSENGYLSHQDISENSNKFRINNLTANKWGKVSMTVLYKGNGTYKPFSKTYFFDVQGIACQFAEYNSTWGQSYVKYIDQAQYRDFWRLHRVSDDAPINFDTTRPCTVTAINDMGEPIESKIVLIGSNTGYFNATRLDVYLTPNTLGVATIQLEYPGDDIYLPATYIYDITVRQHMVDLKWVDADGKETDEWETNYGNGYNGIPTLKMYIDNQEVNLSNWASRLTFSSSDPEIASMKTDGNNPTNTSQYVDFHKAGITVIQVSFVNQARQVDGINYYYYNDESSSYTMILEYGNVDPNNEPHIVWISAGRDWGSAYGNNGRGSYLGQKFIEEKDAAKRAEYPFKGNSAGYGNNIFVSAIALKKSITDADLEAIHIFKIPGYANHYYVMDDPNEQWWSKGAWRAHRAQYIPDSYLFDTSDRGQNNIKYMVDRPSMLRDSKTIPGNVAQNNASGENYWPTSGYKITPAYASQDSLKIYAYIENHNVFSTTKVLVNPGDLQLRFVPDYGTVNAGYSISPYVNCPDLRLEDVKKIWLTYDCPNTLNVANDGVVYEAGVTTQANIAKYLYTVAANDTIWNNADNHSYGIREIRPTTWLRGINPEIFGKSTGIGSECTVTIHLTSEKYQEATADYTLTVKGNDGNKPMFHWEVNHQKQGNDCVDDGNMKEIYVAEGDFIYMPGICGNSNGNNDFSPGYTFKYLYSVKNGEIIMNRAPYFKGEGVPNYYLANSLGGEPAVPQSGQLLSESQKAIIVWCTGLGSNPRKDSLMIYGNKAGVMYLYAQDPQTKKTCTPIKLTVVSKAELNQVKQAELAGMTYPFTWDFEHMDMTKYVADVETNSGTYWQKKFVEPDKADNEQGPKRYNRNYSVEKPYYQYNGGMNADWDDKDVNGTTRQRWFKDIYTGGGSDMMEYAPEFKGIMLNLSGLDYWEQKYQRFQIDKQGRFIYFEGGPIFLQLPGFGLTQNKDGKLKTELQGTTENPGTRSYDNYIGGEHNHINTAGFNVNEGYTQMLSVDNTKNKDVTYPVQEKYRNNKVRFVIKAKGGRSKKSDNETPNLNESSQFHIGGASMIIENLTINDINWTQGVHNGYSYYNLDNEEPKVYIVELDPYDPELQDHIYLMFNNDVYVYWMAITNEPRNILSDFDGVTYSYPKDIDMEKTNLTLGMQTTEGIYTKASDAHDGTYALASQGEYTKKNVYQVGSTTPGKGTKVQLEAYIVNNFDPEAQNVQLTKISGNIPKNEGVMLYTTPRMSALADNPVGLEPAWYNRGNTAYSVWNENTGKYDWFTALASDSTNNGNIYNNSHNYYYLPLYFIAQAENMSEANYVAPSTTGGTETPAISDGHVTTTNLLRAVTYGKTLDMDYDESGNQLINFGYNNEFICRKLIYTKEGVQTKEMDKENLYVDNTTQVENTHEDIYYYAIGIDYARFYRINTKSLNHHNRSAYLSLTWDEYIVNTVGKKIIPSSSNSNEAAPSHLRFHPANNPIDIRFVGSDTQGDLVSEDGGFPDGIKEVEQTANEGVFYNLNGVRVNTPSKGVYIINGKKVVVK